MGKGESTTHIVRFKFIFAKIISLYVIEMKSICFASKTNMWCDSADSDYRVTQHSYIMKFLDTSLKRFDAHYCISI
jgi:hypothetical protein